MLALLRVSPTMRLLLAVKTRTLSWPPPESSTQPGKWVLTSAVLGGYWIAVSAIQSTTPALSVELGNQEFTLCTLTPTTQASPNLPQDLTHTVSEVNTYILTASF